VREIDFSRSSSPSSPDAKAADHAAELDPMVAQSEQLSSEYEIRDQARLILVGVITAAICGILIYASCVHLTI